MPTPGQRHPGIQLIPTDNPQIASAQHLAEHGLWVMRRAGLLWCHLLAVQGHTCLLMLLHGTQAELALGWALAGVQCGFLGPPRGQIGSGNPRQGCPDSRWE